MNSGGTVVVVDDERELLDLICEVLDDDGFRVVCMESPRRVVEMDDDLHARLYLLDLMLPGMTGIQLAQRIRGFVGADTSIVAMSASSDMLCQARESGFFDDVLPKPFDLTELISRVETYVG